jgi:hypothetical protein
MKFSQRISAGALTLVFGMGIFALPMTARASEEGRRNTALALGAAAAGLLLTQKNKVPGIAVAAGAAYAYTRYQDKVNDRHKREQRYGYYDRNDRYDRYDRDSRYSNYDRYDRGSQYDRYDRNYSRYDNDRRYSRSYDRNYDRNYDDDCNQRSRRR